MRRSAKMFNPTQFPPTELTVDEARALRAEEARRAEAHADRVVALRARGHLREAAQLHHEYRRSVRRCRLLGERIREDQLLPSNPARAA
jgi:hypothetical protein